MAKAYPEVWKTQDAAQKFAADFQKSEKFLISNIKAKFGFLEENKCRIVYIHIVDGRNRKGTKMVPVIADNSAWNICEVIKNEMGMDSTICSLAIFNRSHISHLSEVLFGGKVLVFGGYLTNQMTPHEIPDREPNGRQGKAA